MDHIQQLINRCPSLSGMWDEISKAYALLEKAFDGQKKLLIAGNGGSAADAEHIVGELMKNFARKRRLPEDFLSRLIEVDLSASKIIWQTLQGGLPALSLSSHTSLTSACINDMESASFVYAQQVYGYGAAGDVFLGISTSGNSKNIIYAMITAKAKGMKTIALTGGSGGDLIQYADAALVVPETETYKIQELHLPIYHTLCLMLEERFFL